MPKTPNGKVDRINLPLPSRERPRLDVAFAPPATDTETVLSQIWSEMLNLNQVGIDDSFFELGGDSLLATRVIVRVMRNLRIELPLMALFELPTVAQLAGMISQKGVRKIGDMELAALVAEIESLSDKEVQRRLGKR